MTPKMIIFDKMAVAQRYEIEIQPKFYPTFSCMCPIYAKKNLAIFNT
jgi:hypothetical protein